MQARRIIEGYIVELCLKPIKNRSKTDNVVKKCHLIKGHTGNCQEAPYLGHLKAVAPRVANKIERDATKTSGASWKSDSAGPNRISRWVMLDNDEALLARGIDMSQMAAAVQSKLRDKAASYEDCMEVAAYLTWTVYQMPDAPECEETTKKYLENRFGTMQPNSTKCIVCQLPLSFKLFENAVRGRADIETAHKSPRVHNAGNVGFAHRHCNIAQGNKTLDDFYDWIEGISSRVQR